MTQTVPSNLFGTYPSFNYRKSMDITGPINAPSKNKSFIHVTADSFIHFVVTVPIKPTIAKNAVKSLSNHWIVKFGPSIYLITDCRSEFIIVDMAQLCHMFTTFSRNLFFTWD